MPPLQRRTLAACIFALAFILFYEARGERLIAVERQAGESYALMAQHYWEQTGAGIFVVCIGTLLVATLRRPGHNPVYTAPELSVYALAFGILVGTAVSSWLIIEKLRNGG